MEALPLTLAHKHQIWLIKIAFRVWTKVAPQIVAPNQTKQIRSLFKVKM